MYSYVKTVSLTGLEGEIVDVECDISKAVPRIVIVGLPDQSIKEAAERVRSAIKNSGLPMPRDKCTINLAPAYLKKDGSHMDLAICCAILGAMGEVRDDNVKDFVVIGELTLDGSVNPVEGALPMVIVAREKGFRKAIVPYGNKDECAVLNDMEIYPVKSLKDCVDFLNKDMDIPKEVPHIEYEEEEYRVDFKDIKGQKNLKRAMEIAAAGAHNLIMIGPPGSGKSMAASRMPTILPPLEFEESIEVTKIYSISGLMMGKGLITKRPFRSPHHTSSRVSLIGGGQIPKPGEISLAHKGVLFLDELPEFDKNVIEVLRQPMEKKSVDIARVRASLSYPANFILIAAMNPCPCGYYLDSKHECTCTPTQVERYLAKVSHPLLDRIDLHVEISPVEFEDISSKSTEESSKDIRKRVIAARQIQYDRYKGEKFMTNADIPDNKLQKYAPLSKEVMDIIKVAFDRYGFSARTHNKIVKIARTIADLDGAENINTSHILEAIRYRTSAQKYWKK